jgi:hypothetical protein
MAVNSNAPSTSTISLPSDKFIDSTDSESAKDPLLSSPTTANAPQTHRYFIMKSLTKEDLAWSVANKVWATQPHNEGILNDAFKVNSLQSTILRN